MENEQLIDPQDPYRVRPFLSDEKNLKQIIQNLEEANKPRIAQYTQICEKYNGKPPYDPSQLKALNQGWRSNRPTYFMTVMINMMSNSYVNPIQEMKYLTASKLDSDTSNEQQMEQKSLIFRDEITKCIRSWPEFGTLYKSCVLERLLYGYVGALHLDDIDFRPVMGRVDDLLLPEDAPSNENDIPYFAFKDQAFPHVLIEKVLDPEFSQAAGWRIDALIKAINSATPPDSQSGEEVDQRKMAERLRKYSASDSYSKHDAVVKIVHVFAKEISGSVSHWIVEYKTGEVLFENISQFKSMSDVLTLFPLEIGVAGKGSGKVHGSRGAGRNLYNSHIALDQARNRAADAFYLSGLIPVKSSASYDAMKPAIAVHSPVMVLDSTYELAKDAKIDVDVDSFLKLDNHIVSTAQALVQIYMPAQQYEDPNQAATRIKYMERIEAEVRSEILGQFFSQFFKMIGKIQKRICSASNLAKAVLLRNREETQKVSTITSDIYEMYESLQIVTGVPMDGFQVEDQPDVLCCLRMLRQGLSVEEIVRLAHSPAGLTTEDASVQDASAIEAVVSRYYGDKSVRQSELRQMDISSKLGFNKSKMLVIPEEDDTITTEATRKQIEELVVMKLGEEMPVSPRDDHMTHMNVIMQKAKEMSQQMESMAPEMVNLIVRVLDHFDNHLNSAMAAGMQQDQLADQISFSQTIRQMVEQAGAQARKQTEAVESAAQQYQPAL